MYKIEITADTLAELAGKTATLAAKLNTGNATEAPRYVGPLTGEAEPEGKAPTASADTAASSAPDTTPENSTQTSDTGPSATKTASPTKLDFDTDVAPYVLQVVKEKGKPVAQEILSQFGVDRASLLEPHLWPELVEQLKGAL